MKIHYYIWGGGIFSLIVQGILQNYAKIGGDEFYFESSMIANFKNTKDQYVKNNKLTEENVLKIKTCNPFDFILDQSFNNIDQRIELVPVRSFHAKNRKLSTNLALLSNYHNTYKKVFKWKEELLKEFKKIDELVDETKIYLGIHCRFTTMNYYNGVIPLTAFSDLADSRLNKDMSIIIISDNEESLSRLRDKYNGYDIIFNENLNTRFKYESNDIKNNIGEYQTKDYFNFFTKDYWFNALKEAYLLSKANIVVKRASNLNTMSMVMRGSLQEELYVPGSL